MSQMLVIYLLEWQKGIEIEDEKRKNHNYDFSDLCFLMPRKKQEKNKESLIDTRFRFEHTASNEVESK